MTALMRDAYGRRRSSRSIPTGPGSRGGQWHDPAFRSKWWRDYNRKRRPALKGDRDRKRAHARGQRRNDPQYTEAALAVVRAEVLAHSLAHVARMLLVDRRAIDRWLGGENVPSGVSVDAIVVTYGLRRILGEFARLRRGRPAPYDILTKSPHPRRRLRRPDHLVSGRELRRRAKYDRDSQQVAA